MNWTDHGWDAEPWAKGEPYDKWRLAATIRMIEHYAARRGQQEEPPKKKPVPKKSAQGADKFGSLFG